MHLLDFPLVLPPSAIPLRFCFLFACSVPCCFCCGRRKGTTTFPSGPRVTAKFCHDGWPSSSSFVVCSVCRSSPIPVSLRGFLKLILNLQIRRGTRILGRFLGWGSSLYEESLQRLGLFSLERRHLGGGMIETYNIMQKMYREDRGVFFSLSCLSPTQ